MPPNYLNNGGTQDSLSKQLEKADLPNAVYWDSVGVVVYLAYQVAVLYSLHYPSLAVRFSLRRVNDFMRTEILGSCIHTNIHALLSQSHSCKNH